MDSNTAEILELERQFWQTMIDRDVDASIRLTDDPCIVAGAQGTAKIDHAMFRQMMIGGTWKLHRFEFKNAQVYFPSTDLAIVAYDVHEELTVDGAPLNMDAADTSVWTRRDGRWVCSLHTESVKGDPYGRDRKR
ncbi:MAG: nuclear transport factor 2 family protein [Bacteroidota bacterium]|nr:nuclear transport factor 2 family protein [Bacteroidota bacterium]MDP4234054.1 nuclear transport factor 2 family protein [Bacteroidota bacterium]